MRRKVLVIIGIFLLCLVVLVAAFFFMFPMDSVRHFAEKEIEKTLKYEQTVEISKVSVSPLLNATLSGFSMTPKNAESDNLSTEGGMINGYYCASSIDPQSFIVDEILVKPSIISLIKRKPTGKFDMKIQDGSIKGDLQYKKDTMIVNADGNAISLNEFALLSNFTQMQIYGELGFNARIVMDKKNIAEVTIDINSIMTTMCPKRLKLKLTSIPYIDLPFTVFGNIEANLELKGDKLIIHKLTSDGPDVALDVKGNIILKSANNPVPRLDINAVIRPSEQWVTDNNMKVIYQVCEKHDDGSIELDLHGTTKRIKHDCGTPKPEPVEETESDDNNESDNANAEDNKKDDKKADDAKDDDKKADDAKKDSIKKDDKADKDEKSKDSAKDGDVAKPVRPSSDNFRMDNGSRRTPRSERRRSRELSPNGRPEMPSRGEIPFRGDMEGRNPRNFDRPNRDPRSINMESKVESDIRRFGRGRDEVPNVGRDNPE